MTESSNRPVSSWNIPNALTVGRLLLGSGLPRRCRGLGLKATTPHGRPGRRSIFLVAAVTDLVDGELARRTGQVTSFGKIADPIADKALTGSALVLLSWFDLLPWWVTVVIIARELAVTLLRFWVIRHGVMAASRGGKLKTALQILAITLYLLPLASGAFAVAEWVMGAAVVVTLVTGVDYGFRAVALRQGSTRAAEREAQR